VGFFDKFKREMYINKLIAAYKKTYGCGDFAAMDCLTKNYSTKELKEIYDFFRDAKKTGLLDTMILAPQFKEDLRIVIEIDKKFKGN
jgi:hypothetical protein